MNTETETKDFEVLFEKRMQIVRKRFRTLHEKGYGRLILEMRDFKLIKSLFEDSEQHNI